VIAPDRWECHGGGLVQGRHRGKVVQCGGSDFEKLSGPLERIEIAAKVEDAGQFVQGLAALDQQSGSARSAGARRSR
jgi:hypothetical protein